ncbi:MAG: hypothetical protein HYS81_03550 [Candidatus Aenigmatarchaeota archaeon]|nr:MAG: hypothetical protein HYS81_03550 [Candidatus Aenigmarchaeota archaeon]
MRSKGISPIIASVLIVLVVIGLAATYTTWSSRIFGQVTEESGEAVTRTTQQLFSQFDIQGAADQRVFIKNTGTSKLSQSALEVFYDGEPIAYAADFDVLERDELGTLTLRGLWKYGAGDHALRVTAGSFADSSGVTASTAHGVAGDWRFEEGSGASAGDSSGNGNTGAIANAVYATDTPHASSHYALSFNGANSKVSIPPSTSFNVYPGVRTIEVWIKRTSGWAVEQEFSNVEVGNLEIVGWSYEFASTYQDGPSEANCGYPTQWKANTWHHVVVQQNRVTGGQGYLRAYLDGILVCDRSGLSFGQGPNSYLYFGARGTNNDLWLNGLMDDVRVYAGALTPDELYALKLKN